MALPLLVILHFSELETGRAHQSADLVYKLLLSDFSILLDQTPYKSLCFKLKFELETLQSMFILGGPYIMQLFQK